jgi:hypothetical protein
MRDRTSNSDLPADVVRLVLCVAAAVAIVAVTERWSGGEAVPEGPQACTECIGVDGD